MADATPFVFISPEVTPGHKLLSSTVKETQGNKNRSCSLFVQPWQLEERSAPWEGSAQNAKTLIFLNPNNPLIPERGDRLHHWGQWADRLATRADQLPADY